MKRNGTNQRLLSCVILLSLAQPGNSASAAEYEVDGKIELSILSLDAGVELVNRSKFTVFVRDCSWLVQTTDLDENGKPFMARETACTNGSESYEVAGEFNEANEGEGSHPDLHLNQGYIVSNNVPVGQSDDYLVGHLWLMFASGCYFENLATNWLTPVYDLDASATVNPKLKREAKWELINGPGSLPSSVVYFKGAGVTDATYTATGMTNAGTTQIPAAFVFEERVEDGFAPGPILPGEAAPVYRIRKRATATVTAARPVCSRSDLLPAAEGMSIVIDQRLAPMTSPTNTVAYNVRHGVQWLPVAQARQLQMAQSTSLNGLKPPYGSQSAAQKGRSGLTALFYVSGLSLSTVCLFLWSRSKRKPARPA